MCDVHYSYFLLEMCLLSFHFPFLNRNRVESVVIESVAVAFWWHLSWAESTEYNMLTKSENPIWGNISILG